MLKTRLIFLLPCIANAVAQAQVAAPTSVVAASVVTASVVAASVVVQEQVLDLTILGPAAWQSRLAPTNVGSLFESELGRQIIQPQAALLESFSQGVLGGNEGLMASLRECLNGFSGAMRVFVWQPKGGGFFNPHFSVGVVIGPDGKSDLTKIAKVLTDVIGKAAGIEWQKEKVAETELDVVATGAERITAPIRVGDRLLMLYGDGDLAPLLAALKETAVVAPKSDAPVASMTWHCRAIYAVSSNIEKSCMNSLGFSQLNTVQCQLRSAGPLLLCDTEMRFLPGADRGLFGGLFPNVSSMSRLVTILPADATAWKVGHIDLAQTYVAVERLIAKMDGQSFGLRDEEIDPDMKVDEQQQKLRAEATKELGLDPVDGLLAYTATDALLLGFLADLEARGQFAFALRLRDEAAFRTAFNQMLEKCKGLVNKFEDIDHNGITICRYGTMLGAFYCAIGRGMIVIAGGEVAEARVKSLLDAAQALPLAASEKPAKAIAGFESIARYSKADSNGAGMTSIVPTLQLGFGGIASILQPILGRNYLNKFYDEDQLDQLAELLTKYQLDRVRMLTGYADDTWRCRIFW